MIYRFLLSQHIGRPAIPCVKVGDMVARGRRLAAKPEGALGAHIHASVGGEVRAIGDLFVEVEADEECAKNADYIPIEGHTVLELTEAAGIVGAGGAGFPTAAKLARPLEEGGVLILNAAECEPTLCHNIALLEREPARVMCGMLHAMRAVRASGGVIAIKEKHARAISALHGATDASEKISIRLLPDQYPSGEERALIRETRGVLLRPEQLPFEANCAVLNVETAARVADAVERRKPFMSKDMTLAGRYRAAVFADRGSEVLFDVPIGMAVQSVVERAGGLSEDCGELLVGGPFTGKAALQDTPVTKLTGGILAAMPFLRAKAKLGLLACACGAGRERLTEIANRMGGEIAGVEHCKQSQEMPNGARKCENPGKCPGQAEKVLSLYRQGARALLIGNCSDCTNTVMTIADKLPVAVYHSTDGVLRAAGEGLIRRKK